MTGRHDMRRTIRSSPAIDPPLTQRRASTGSTKIQHRRARTTPSQLHNTSLSPAPPPVVELPGPKPLLPAPSSFGHDVETQWPVASKEQLTITCTTPPSPEETGFQLSSQTRGPLALDESDDDKSLVSEKQEQQHTATTSTGMPCSPGKLGCLRRSSQTRRVSAIDMSLGDMGENSPVQMKRMSFARHRAAGRRSIGRGFRLPLNSVVTGSDLELVDE